MTESSHERTTCRICGARDLTVFLDLGMMPLVNRYLHSAGELATEVRYPLQVAYCSTCWLSQLTCVVDPAVLYADYAYHSSVSRTFQAHCRRMAADLTSRYGLDQDSSVMEIASNDGCLQQAFLDQSVKVLGIEPAENLARVARAKGLQVINQFWSHEAARLAVETRGAADLILATNVLAHVDDLSGFLSAIRSALSPKGTFIFEVPYLISFLTKTEFDTTYHEHLSYFLLTPLQRALEAAGLRLADAGEFAIHGGSIRVHATADMGAEPASNVVDLLRAERDFGFLNPELYHRFGAHVNTVREELKLFLEALHSRDRRIAAYGASAKGNVLLNYCGMGPELVEYILDDTPAKQGRFSPGNGIPIVSREHLNAHPPDYLLLLAWNFSEELMANLPEFKQNGGRFVVPIPALRVV